MTAFHRTITAIYLVCLLELLTHIQLNLLGRYNYVSSVYEQALPDGERTHENGNGLSEKDPLCGKHDGIASAGKKLDSVSERQYLSFGWWFLQKGWRQVSELVKQVVDESLSA